jgi:methylmalonyl-CoA/ethylmalonyl-CoA epimerase
MVALPHDGRERVHMTLVRRLDHVAVVVWSTSEALKFYEGHLGLRVQSSEEIESPPVRLTYVDTGNAFLQLVEPLDPTSSIAAWLEEHGEGLHHICFGVDDVEHAVTALSDPGTSIMLGNGRGRVSSFVSTGDSHGVRIECTEFQRASDVDAVRGYLGD